MNITMSVLRNSSSGTASPRGFVYYCEEQRQYRRGLRAWIFGVSYLAGAILLEPQVSTEHATGWVSWLPLLGFLILFPPLWRTLLRLAGRRQ